MRYYTLLILLLSCIVSSAQLITQKNGLYGITDITTSEVLLEQQFDLIYQLKMRPQDIMKDRDDIKLPIFVCSKDKRMRLFNVITKSFYEGIFDDIKLYRQVDEQGYGLKVPKYTPYWVDCFMLKSGDLWGYISYRKEYNFQDALEKTDTFKIVPQQYQELKFVEEEYGYDSKKYTRKRRIVAAMKDSLWGALSFESGTEIVPFKYSVPIHSFRNSYDNGGLEFLSTKGGFIPYYVARRTWDTKPQIVINQAHSDISFEFNYVPKVNIYNEYAGQFMYVEPKEGEEGYFELFEYNTGKKLISYPRDLRYKDFRVFRRMQNLLIIDERTSYEKLYRQTWFNLTSGKVILLAEGTSGDDINFGLNEENSMIVMKGKKAIGKIVGEGADMTIEWTTKRVYTKDANQN